MFSSAGLK